MRKFVVLLITTITFAGCASLQTMNSAKSYYFLITTSPNHAKIAVYDNNNIVMMNSITPALTKLELQSVPFIGIVSGTFRIEVTKEGYDKQVVEIQGGGPAGWIIMHPTSGSRYAHTRDSRKIHLELSKITSLENNGADNNDTEEQNPML